MNSSRLDWHVVVWMMASVVLPWGHALLYIRSVMEAIADSNVDAGAYWHTQREHTVDGQRFMQNALRRKR